MPMASGIHSRVGCAQASFAESTCAKSKNVMRGIQPRDVRAGRRKMQAWAACLNSLRGDEEVMRRLSPFT